MDQRLYLFPNGEELFLSTFSLLFFLMGHLFTDLLTILEGDVRSSVLGLSGQLPGGVLQDLHKIEERLSEEKRDRLSDLVVCFGKPS